MPSKFIGPFAGGVEDAQDFEGVGADSIGDDVGSVGDDEFARAGDSAGAADGGIFSEESDSAKNSLDNTVCGGGVVFGDVAGFGLEVG